MISRVYLVCAALLLVAACSRAPEAPPKTVEITGNDQMKFDVSAFEVKAGQNVSVTLKNVGTLPKDAMGHDFTLLAKGAVRLKKILVPMDFSDCSMAGLESAVRFARIWGAGLVMFNCVPLQTFATYGEYGEYDLTSLTDYAQRAANEEMDEVVSKLKSQDIIVEGVVELGVPAQAICDYARTHEIDLIVTATHGSTGLTHVLGSTAEHVVRYAHCPVLIVPNYLRGGKRLRDPN
jgi:nucleotide-binding universal stress UspA family protein